MKNKPLIIFAVFLFVLISAICPITGILTDTAFAERSVSFYKANRRYLPILMYHNILNNQQGRYIVSCAQLEEDIAALLEQGYTFVTADEVIEFVEGIDNLPDKPIMLTFDDGHYNNMYYGLPIFNKYDVKALFNVVGCFSEYSSASGDSANPNYSHLTWDEIAECSNTGLISFGNHSYKMHGYSPRYGILQMSGESNEEYVERLINDTNRLEKKLETATGKHCRAYAYPFGAYSPLAEDTLTKLGYKLRLTCVEGVTVIEDGKIESIYRLKRLNREGSCTTETLVDKINSACCSN